VSVKRYIEFDMTLLWRRDRRFFSHVMRAKFTFRFWAIVAREKNISPTPLYEGTYTSHNEYKRIEYLKKDSKE